MHGAVATKLLRLGIYLATHPSETGRYLRRSVFGADPLAQGLPWFSFAAIEFLEAHIRPDMVVYEYGSGGSTVFFGRRARRVVAIENDAGWADQVARALANLSPGRVELRLQPFDLRDVEGFGRSSYLHALPQEPADVVVVDSAEDWPGFVIRPSCFATAEAHVKEGGIIVVDDSWRYPEIVEKSRAKRRQRFESVGPARIGVTATDIHWY
ncbi:MAG: class I SAM-dependent methyltransferase [Rhodospirillales bacterium]|nr:class I SAM-dependent methyltransferase [Rhodospirillales bacterium]